ncbi:site-specific DNA-methyltransferase [Pontibacter ruber]|uniref:site-specific DNA-methyltransferase (adenine-specific) n=1 Tax=Pontibacter ruber TaxID=1343895 RepID=A0ABW5D144_9BACT|nr:site-specific DNA-methyltransferase [Pontibacter ruber]
MDTITKDHELAQSQNIVADNINKLKQLFPRVFVEGKIDFDELRSVLGNYVEKENERYHFTWHGKAQAIREAHKTSTGTLRPCPDESVNWENTKNLYLEGDNLEVLKLLQKSYHSRVKMIYIDPPYNTGKDFVYKDNYSDNLKNYLELTQQGKDFGTNSETSGRYHSNWLNMMYPRLKLSRNLLREDGVIFISIDDTEVGNLRKIADEIYGEENFVANVIWQKKYSPQNDAKYFSDSHEHIIAYAKTKEAFNIGLLPRTDEANERYKNPDNDPRGAWKSSDLTRQEFRPNDYYPIVSPKTGKSFFPPKGNSWGRPKEKVEELISDNRIWFGPDGNGQPSLKRFLSEVKQGITPQTIWERKDVGDTQTGKKLIKEYFGNVSIFETPKPPQLIERAMVIANVNEGDIILDFFSGSASTAEAVLRYDKTLNYVLVQIPEPTSENSEAYKSGFHTIAEIGKERIRRVIEKIKEEDQERAKRVDIGFKVFKLDSSNIKDWDPSTVEIQKSLYDSINNIKEDRSESDILFEVLLKYGLDLTLPIEEYKIAGNTVFSIGSGILLVCLSPNLNSDTIAGMGELKDDLSPEVCRVVLRDNGFKNDVAKTNAMQVLKRYGIEDVKSI